MPFVHVLLVLGVHVDDDDDELLGFDDEAVGVDDEADGVDELDELLQVPPTGTLPHGHTST